MSNWGVAIFSLLGVILGAVLQFLLSRTAEKNKHLEALRDQAYSDYLRGVAAVAHIKSDNDKIEAFRLVSDAKARIVVYGTSSTIKALAAFEKSGSVLNNERSKEAFISLIATMRQGKNVMLNDDIRIVLLGVAQQGAPADRPTVTQSVGG